MEPPRSGTICGVLTLIPVIVVAPLWLCWWWMSRIPSIRWRFTLLMVGVYAGGAVVARFWRSNTVLAFLLTVAALVATVLTGRRLEQRRLGPGSARQTLPLYVMAAWLLAVACAFIVVLNLPEKYE